MLELTPEPGGPSRSLCCCRPVPAAPCSQQPPHSFKSLVCLACDLMLRSAAAGLGQAACNALELLTVP